MFCRKCGNKLSDGARFCNKCGCPVMPDDSVQPISQPLPPTTAITPGPDMSAPIPAAAVPEEPAAAPPVQTFAPQPHAPTHTTPAPMTAQTTQFATTLATKKHKKGSRTLRQVVLYILIIALTASATAGIYWLLSPKYETIYVLTESIYESETSRDVTKYEYNELGLLIFESYEYESYDSRGQVQLSSTSCTAYVFGADEDENKLYYFHISDSPYDSVTEGTFTVNDDRQMTSRVLDFGYGYTSTTEWKYDDGNLLEYRSISDGKVRSLNTYTYDADGNEVASATYLDGKLFGESEYIYDGGEISRIEAVSYDDNGEVKSRRYGTVEYDSRGNKIAIIYYDYDNGSETDRYEYVYDAHGNQTEIIYYADGEEFSHTYNTYKAINLPKA